MRAVGVTDKGLIREKNEDSFLINEAKGLFVVCDGMGGHRAGDVASRLAVDIISKAAADDSLEDPIVFLNQAIWEANRAIWLEGQRNPQYYQMGTTVTAAVIKGEELAAANVGDSSLFIIRGNNIHKVTRDHTLAEQMVEDGILGYRDKAFNHILTRALGAEIDVKVDNFIEKLYPGDYVLLCSDGLTDMLEEEEILSTVMGNNDLNETARELVDRALSKGGYDNVTLILLCI